MEKVELVALFIVLIIIVVLGFVIRSIYRYSLRCKAENLEREKEREKERREIRKRERKEIICQYNKIEDNYFNLLVNLQNDLTNTSLRKSTFEAGQQLIEFTSQHVGYEGIELYDKYDLMKDIPGRTDQMFIDALLLCMDSEHINTYLLIRHLGVDRETAESLLQALFQEGFIGEKIKFDDRPVLISSMSKMEKRIDEAKEKEKKENEIFQVELVRLTNSDEYKYINQFTKKYGKNFSDSELTKLQDLLHIQGFEFSNKQMTNIINLALNQQKYRDAKFKILIEEPSEVQDIIKNYLNFYESDDNEMFEVLKEIIEEKDLFGLFKNDPEKLKKEVERIEREIELKIFEKRLLEDADEICIENLDQLNGYEFEEFLKNLYSKMGYQVEQTKLSGDQGADLVVIKFGEKSVIQAKRFGGKVGNKAVQEILAAISLYKAQKGIVITNSYFTPAAFELAEANNIELIDRNGLEELINKHW